MPPKNILYIEDESFMGRTIVNKLKENKYDAELAPDGESGLSALESKQYDLVLLDLILPNMNGFEVLKKIKENPKTKSIPVVVFSNQSTEEDKNRARELGAHDFLVKVNSTPNELLVFVRTLLK